MIINLGRSENRLKAAQTNHDYNEHTDTVKDHYNTPLRRTTTHIVHHQQLHTTISNRLTVVKPSLLSLDKPREVWTHRLICYTNAIKIYVSSRTHTRLLCTHL